MWTLDELVERVRRALAAEYPGAPNGRVRDLPDRRAIRWYTTTGLVDRPLGMRGRTALYGSRHLLQLVALKRRQAEGRTLAEIQTELAGAADDALAGVARVPADLLVMNDGPRPDPETQHRTRFWSAAAPAAAAIAPAAAVAPGPINAQTPTAAPGPTKAQAAAVAPGPIKAEAPTAAPGPTKAQAAAIAPGPTKAEAAAESGAAEVESVGGVVLGRGAILVLPGLPTDEERAEIAAVARPLMELLAERGLLKPENGSPS